MLLAPERENLRLGEAIWIKRFQVISPVLVGPLAGWKGIRPAQVARAMVFHAIKQNHQKVYLYQDMVE